MSKLFNKPKEEPKKSMSILLLIILLIVFWPLAIVYMLWCAFFN